MKDISTLKKEMENLNIELNTIGWFIYLDYIGVNFCGSCRYCSRYAELEEIIEQCRYCVSTKHQFEKMDYKDWVKSLKPNF